MRILECKGLDQQQETTFVIRFNPGWNEVDAYPAQFSLSFQEILQAVFYNATLPQLKHSEHIKLGVICEQGNSVFRLFKAGKKNTVFEALNAQSDADLQLPKRALFERVFIWPWSEVGVQKHESSEYRQLKQEWQTHKTIQSLDAELNEAQLQLFEVDERLQQCSKLRVQLEKVEKKYAEYQFLDQPDFAEDHLRSQLKHYPAQANAKQDALCKLEDELLDIEDEIQLLPNDPWWRQPESLAGVILGVAGFIGASFFREVREIFWVMLLLCILGAVILGVGFFLGHQRRTRVRGKQLQIRDLQRQMSKVEEVFLLDTQEVQHLFDVLNTTDAQDALEVLNHKGETVSKKQKLEQQLRQLQTQCSEQALLNEKQSLEDKITEIEHKQKTLTIPVSDPIQVYQDLMKFEQDQHMPSETLAEFLTAITELLQQDTTVILSQCAQQIRTALKYFTDHHVLKAQFDQQFDIYAVETQQGLQDFAALNSDQQTQTVLAIRCAVLSFALQYYALPLILIQPSVSEFGHKFKQLCTQYRFFPEQTQVIMLKQHERKIDTAQSRLQQVRVQT